MNTSMIFFLKTFSRAFLHVCCITVPYYLYLRARKQPAALKHTLVPTVVIPFVLTILDVYRPFRRAWSETLFMVACAAIGLTIAELIAWGISRLSSKR